MFYKANAAPVLYTGAQGETAIAILGDYAEHASTGGVAGVFVQEFALPSALIGGSSSAIVTSFGLSHVIAAPTAPGTVYGNITLDGSLGDWTASDRIDTASPINNLEVYGKLVGGAMVFALKVSDALAYTIGSETRIWLNTDLDNNSGAAVPLWNISGSPTVQLGVEYNVRFDQAGHPMLDTGATFVPKGGAGYYSDIVKGVLDYGMSANGKVVEFAVPVALLGGATSANVHLAVPGVGSGPYPNYGGRGYTLQGIATPPPPGGSPITLPPPPPPPVGPPPPPVNYFPAITSYGGGTAAVTVLEKQTLAAVVSASDANTGQTLSYTLVGGADRDLFVIDQQLGVISFKTAPNFDVPADWGGNNVYDVIAYVTDGAGGMASQALAITVADDGVVSPPPPPPPPLLLRPRRPIARRRSLRMAQEQAPRFRLRKTSSQRRS